MKRVKAFRWGEWAGRYIVGPLILLVVIAALLGALLAVTMFTARMLGL